MYATYISKFFHVFLEFTSCYVVRKAFIIHQARSSQEQNFLFTTQHATQFYSFEFSEIFSDFELNEQPTRSTELFKTLTQTRKSSLKMRKMLLTCELLLTCETFLLISKNNAKKIKQTKSTAFKWIFYRRKVIQKQSSNLESFAYTNSILYNKSHMREIILTSGKHNRRNMNVML